LFQSADVLNEKPRRPVVGRLNWPMSRVIAARKYYFAPQ